MSPVRKVGHIKVLLKHDKTLLESSCYQMSFVTNKGCVCINSPGVRACTHATQLQGTSDLMASTVRATLVAGAFGAFLSKKHENGQTHHIRWLSSRYAVADNKALNNIITKDIALRRALLVDTVIFMT